MRKREIAILIAIIAIIATGGVYASASGMNSIKSAQNDLQNTTLNETHMKEHTKSAETPKKTNETIKTNITAEQAKQIAKQYIETSGAYPGTPKLLYQKAYGSFKGGYIWKVPVMLNGNLINGILIDAQTGQNLGEG